MSLEGQVFNTSVYQQRHIATPTPLPYHVRSNTVLRSMMCKELRDKKGATSDTPPQFEHDLNGHETSAIVITPSRARIQIEEDNDTTKDAEPKRFAYFRLPNPIEPLLLALLTPEMAEERDGYFVPPSPYCRCRPDSIQWPCQEEYTKDVSVNAWGY